jgi:hypothetical protein
VCNTKLFLGKNKGLFKLRLVNDKMVVHKVTKNNTNIITFKLLFNFVFNFTNVGPMDELKIVAGKDPTEKQAKNIAAISLE